MAKEKNLPAKAATPAKAAAPAAKAVVATPAKTTPPAAKAPVKAGKGKGKEKKDIPAELAASGDDAEVRRTRLKNLIALGKERGYLTYAEVNDHLPDEMVDAEQIESIISTFNDMGIKVFDEAPAAEEVPAA